MGWDGDGLGEGDGLGGGRWGWGGRWVWVGRWVWGGKWVGEEDGLGAGLFTGWMPFTECAQTDTHTQTHKSENSISASFTPFTWRI